MFLHSIELFGFKSFPERTRIEFSEGITALLGPNGCGKSNIVDAVKWVLGEQSTKSLRADSMEDVIFNGTENRKPLNWTEVVLTLRNEAGVLDLDLPEIMVSRRLFRNGDSEYSINKTAAKLKDIRDLFMDTGVGKSAYSIMEQGRIDQILSNKPEERRYIFEEAAGISKFKARSLEAERKLEKTEENLRQVEGILTEVKRSYDTLKAQAAKTEHYRKIRQEIYILEKELALRRLRHFREKEAETDRQLKLWEDQRQTLNGELNRLNASMEEGLADVGRWENELKEIQKSLHDSEIQRSQTLAQEKILQERKIGILEQGDVLKREASRLQAESQEKTTQTEKIRQEMAALEDDVAKDVQNIAQFEERLQYLLRQVIYHNGEVTRLNGAEARIQEGIKHAMGELTGLTEGLVRAIDEGIARDPGLWESIQTWYGEMSVGLERLLLLLHSRKNRLFDIHSSGRTLADEDIEGWIDALNHAVNEAQTLRVAWERYESSAPAILRELLSQEGTLTKKRQADAGLRGMQIEAETTRKDRAVHLEQVRLLEQQAASFRETLEELKINQARRETQRHSRAAEIQRLSLEEGVLRAKMVEADMRRAEDAARVGVLHTQMLKLQTEIEDLGRKESTLRAGEEALRARILQESATLGSEERQLKDLFSQLSKLQEAIEKKSRENGEYRADLRAVLENFKERHGVDLDEAGGKECEGEAETLRAKLQDLREALKALGQVNLMATEEFAEASQRYDFLRQQITDLREARENLRNIVVEIKKESSHLFQQTFSETQKNFHNTFRRLFGGGRAEIRLTHDGDILESGVELLCQPPGKRLESISLLSGGERSLTAVALLFAVYMVRPSPFCILDEIDAALDESNVGRFMGMLCEFAARSQFIVITHNKRTVAGSASMIGITMEESGVSKVLSIRLGHQGGMV